MKFKCLFLLTIHLLNIFQLPRALIEPILYSAMVFWIAGLFGGFAAFVQFCVPIIACAVAATAWGK